MVRLEDAEKGDMEPQTFNRTVTRLNAEVAAITAERDAMKREIASLRKEITDWSQK
jgi:phage host-nuclease inhibitor protein Gam